MKPLDVVFLTNFSDTCFRAIPAVAQMVDDFAVRLTILHAYDIGDGRKTAHESALRSFFPEADSYPGTRRMLVNSSPIDALRQLAQVQNIDLVICPGCDPLGLPRIGHRSLRARIVHECGLPVWTIGRKIDPARLAVSPRNVACWMEFGEENLGHLAFAIEYAWKMGAQLHLLHALPEIDEALLYQQDEEKPMNAPGVRRAFHKLLHDAPIRPIVHVHSGNGMRSRAALAKMHDADILFTSVTRSPLTEWIMSAFNTLDRCPCPVVAISQHAPGRLWNLERGRAWRGQEVTRPVRVLEPAFSEPVLG